MKIKEIEMKNIRSYENEIIKFESSSMLLRGDIGSGKSTILMAIEFGLFGFRPKEMDGTTLLAHGETEGSVKLKIEIDKEEVIIKRIIKKGSKTINQNAGYIITKGKKEELTPIELKARIVNMLGYPTNIISKSKDLIFRYTVYTPQDKLKSIIQESPENRLEVLRKVFNINKYKQIKDNAIIYIKILKERGKVLEGKSSGIEERKTELKHMIKLIKEQDINIQKQKVEHNTLKIKLNSKQEGLSKFEAQIKEMERIKTNLGIIKLKEEMKIEERQRDSENILREGKKIEEIKKDCKEIEKGREEEIEEEMITKDKIIKLCETKIRLINQKITEFQIIKNNAAEIKSNITALDKCPTCEQKVSEEYKSAIITREDNKVGACERNQELYSKQLRVNEKEIAKAKASIEMRRKETETLEINKLKIRNMREKITQKEEIEKKQATLKSEIKNLNQKKITHKQELTNFSGIEDIYESIKKELEIICINERKLALEINSIEKEKQGMQMMAANLEKEINQKKEAIKSLRKTQETIQWLDKYFINIIAIIEKQVLFSIHNKFNNQVKEWFNILIEEERMEIKIDKQFTPIITQKGYDTKIQNLSGGEKAAVAIAYRLALNEVISELMPGIKTGDIIILDEPTEGFSTNQLDKVREIIEQIKAKQIIIVSHEQKIETFVNKVITITKEGNKSKTY